MRQIPQFRIISWCRHFAKRHSFGTVSRESPETMRKLCLSAKFSHQEMRWNYGILRREPLFPRLLRKRQWMHTARRYQNKKQESKNQKRFNGLSKNSYLMNEICFMRCSCDLWQQNLRIWKIQRNLQDKFRSYTNHKKLLNVENYKTNTNS